MHQQPPQAPFSPNRSSRAGHRSGVSGRIVSFKGDLLAAMSVFQLVSAVAGESGEPMRLGAIGCGPLGHGTHRSDAAACGRHRSGGAATDTGQGDPIELVSMDVARLVAEITFSILGGADVTLE